jgi:hypothetical protein
LIWDVVAQEAVKSVTAGFTIVENVLGAAELSTLIQPWPASLVLVTTRQMTDDLWVWSQSSPVPQPGPVFLHGLDLDGARELLESRAPGTLATDPAAADRLLELCDRMPFAIQQVAMLIARRGSVGAVLDELASSEDSGELSRRCLARTIDELPASAVDDLVALAGQPVRELSHEAATAALGHRADALVDAGLIVADQGRLWLPHLVRDHAARLPAATSTLWSGRPPPWPASSPAASAAARPEPERPTGAPIRRDP